MWPVGVKKPARGSRADSRRCVPHQVPGETLFPIKEAIEKGTIIMNLLSDAAQSQTWPEIAPLITKGKTLYFAHGFSVVYKDDVRCLALLHTTGARAKAPLSPCRPTSCPPRTST